MPDESYAFTARTYHNLAKAEIRPLAVLDVLYGRHLVRRHLDGALQIAGQDRDGTWLAVALIEGGDEEYTVLSARYLDEDEITTITRLLRRNQ